MRGLWAIMRLEFASLARSRAAHVLFAVSAGWMIAAGFLVKGDGTEAGFASLYIRYSLGVVFTVLLVACAAASAGAIAKDRERRILALSLVRPVPRISVALGRTAAISLCGAAVLAVACAMAYFKVGRGGTCVHVHAPVMEEPLAVAEKLYAKYMEEYPEFKERTKSVSRRDILRFLVQQVKSEYETVSPGKTAEWMFDDASGDCGAVRIRITEMFGRYEKLAGEFSFRGRKGAFEDMSKSVVTIPLEGGAGEGENVLSLANKGTAGISLHPRTDMLLLSPGDSNFANFFRAFLQLSSILAAAAAFGVFMGSFLGRSVAVFCVISLLFTMAVSPTVADSYPDPLDMPLSDRISLALSDFSAAASAPLNDFEPVSRLEDGFCVEWRETFRALALDMLLLPLVFSFFAGFLASRKE